MLAMSRPTVLRNYRVMPLPGIQRTSLGGQSGEGIGDWLKKANKFLKDTKILSSVAEPLSGLVPGKYGIAAKAGVQGLKKLGYGKRGGKRGGRKGGKKCGCGSKKGGAVMSLKGQGRRKRRR